MIKVILFLFIGTSVLAQTVSTYFSDPSISIDDALAIDLDGNLYGSHFFGSNVYKVTPGGVASIFAPGFANPNGLAFDPDGNLFIVEYSGSSIHKYNPSGTLLETYNVTGFVSGLVATPGGTMIFTNVSDESLNEIAADGTITQLFQGGPLNAPVGLTYDNNNVLYVGNYVGREIYKLVGGSLEYVATVPDGGAVSNAFLGFITYHQGTGKLYGTVIGAHKIYEIDPNGVDQVTSFAGGIQGGVDGDISFATFDSPNGIYYNAADNSIYVSELTFDGNVRKIEFNIASIPDSKRNSFIVYPNPVSNQLFIQSMSNDRVARIIINDVSGKKIATFLDETKGLSAIDVTNLVAGMFFMEIVATDGTTSRYSFIKQ